jgi:hypothetical protein
MSFVCSNILSADNKQGKYSNKTRPNENRIENPVPQKTGGDWQVRADR